METNMEASPWYDMKALVMSCDRQGHIKEQHCTMDPRKSDHAMPAEISTTSDPSTEDLFNVLANIQGQRLNDQRVSLASLPGLNYQDESQSEQERCRTALSHGQHMSKGDQCCPITPNLKSKPTGNIPPTGITPQVMLREGTPDTSRKTWSRPTSPTLRTSSKVIPKSASFSSTEYQKMQHSSSQVNYPLSLTEQVHTAQLQKQKGPGEEKGDTGKGKAVGKTDKKGWR